MEYRLPLKHSGYMPLAYALLAACMDESFSNHERKLHHPIDIYNISSREVWENLDDLLEEIDIIVEKQHYLPGSDAKNWKKNLIRQLDHTLDAIAQHVDSCRAIIKCCYPNEKNSKFSKPVRRFNSEVKPYFDHVCNIVNAVKHEQRSLQIIYFHNPGFFCTWFLCRGLYGVKNRSDKSMDYQVIEENGNRRFYIYEILQLVSKNSSIASLILDHAPEGSGNFWICFVPPYSCLIQDVDGEYGKVFRIGIGIKSHLEITPLEAHSANYEETTSTLASAEFDSGHLEIYIEERSNEKPVVIGKFTPNRKD